MLLYGCERFDRGTEQEKECSYMDVRDVTRHRAGLGMLLILASINLMVKFLLNCKRMLGLFIQV